GRARRRPPGPRGHAPPPGRRLRRGPRARDQGDGRGSHRGHGGGARRRGAGGGAVAHALGPPRQRHRPPARRGALGHRHRRAGGPLVARSPREPETVTAVARVDRRTKRLVKRVLPGEIMIIDHADLDRVAAETIVEAQPAAVVNAAASITGRYPNMGPLLVSAAGIPLLDEVGSDVLDRIAEGDVVTVDGERLLVGDEVIATGVRQSMQDLEVRLEAARETMGEQLERFAENTLEYLTKERHLLLDEPDVPDIGIDMKGRHVLIVVRGADYKEDLETL